MKYKEIEQKVLLCRQLESITEEYREIIDFIQKEQDRFRVDRIVYMMQGDKQKQCFDLNSQRTIPVHYIVEGLQDTLNGIDKEIKQLKAELKAMNIEL